MGLSLYCDAFILDLHCIEVRWLNSPLACEVLHELRQHYGLQNDAQGYEQLAYWFPAHLMLRAFAYNLRQLRDSEITHIKQELQRLLMEKERVIEKYQEHVQASLDFYLLVLIYQYENYSRNRYRSQECEQELQRTQPNFYSLYQQQRQKKYIRA